MINSTNCPRFLNYWESMFVS